MPSTIVIAPATIDAKGEIYKISVPGNEATLYETKVYKRRWIVLVLFIALSMCSAIQWIQYSIIANIIMKYYGVESYAVDWMSMVYMITYIPLIFPASWLLDKMGLRVATTIGAVGTCTGAWIKVMSVSPDLFYVTFIGQFVVALSQVFILNAPARLAAVWFGPDQVSSACSLGVFGNQLGVALGFLLPPIIVKNHDNIADIGRDLSTMFYSVAGFTTVLLVLIIFLFRAEPPLPPSPAQAAQRANESEGFLLSIKRLAVNPGYILLLLSYGLNVGVFYAISTLLNQVILSYFPGAEEDAGRIGLTIVLAGMGGSVLSGIVLDKTHKFKETTLGLYIFSLIGMIIFTFTLGSGQIVVVYFISGLLGFFMTGYLPVGFELAAELTYPEPEGTSAGLLNAAAQAFGILLTMSYSWLLGAVGDMWANVALCGALVLGVIFTALIKPDLRRQAAHLKENESQGRF